jgi:alpha-N-arabinofuranosidase
MELDLALHGFDNLKLIDHQVMGGDSSLARVANTCAEPNKVTPRKGDRLAVGEGALKGELPVFSYSMIRLSVG